MTFNGIDGYDLASTSDRAFVFDFDSSGMMDHLVFYRPGDGAFYILGSPGAGFAPVYASHAGIGGYDLKDPADRAFAYDYDGSGKQDHIVLYRPGHKVVFIVKNVGGGQFQPVFTSFTGIDGYDVLSAADEAFAFDFDSSGMMDHLVFYRPGDGAFYILGSPGAGFAPVYASHAGIGGYDLKDPADRAFAYDYDGSGKQDHIVLYRPGQRIAYIVAQTQAGVFSPVYQSENVTSVPELINMLASAAELALSDAQLRTGIVTPPNESPDILKSRVTGSSAWRRRGSQFCGEHSMLSGDGNGTQPNWQSGV